MLVQHQHPVPLSPAPPSQPECFYNTHISAPSKTQSKFVLTTKPEPSTSDVQATTTDPSFTIRQATIEDASSIADLGAKVFSTTFGFSIPPNDLNSFLQQAYTTEAIKEEIQCPKKHIFVACSTPESSRNNGAGEPTANSHAPDNQATTTTQGKIIGFAQLTEGTTEPCLSHVSGAVELQRLYVSTTHHGRGVGRRLASEVEALARKLAYKAIWLGVWEGNFKAQKVYEGLGFAKFGDHEFKMGKCIQMDWIMCKDL